MNISFNNAAQALAELKVAPEDQGRLIALALARAVGYRLPIPTQPQGNLSEYYASNLAEKAAAVVGAINEQYPLNFNKTLAVVQQVWELRYGLVYPQYDLQGWALLDAAVAKGQFGEGVDFSDERLSAIARSISADLAPVQV